MGKIDRNALIDYEIDTTRAASNYEAPTTSMEELVAAIWQEVLKTKQIGRNENFFELGGHSLLATQVKARLQKALQQEVKLTTLFEKRNLGELAAYLETLTAAKSQLKIPPIEKVARTQPLPLSFAQERLWFLQRLAPTSNAYNIAVSFTLIGALNISVLKESLSQIVKRHESLRTTYQLIDETPIQVVAAVFPLELPEQDISSETPELQKQLVDKISRQQATQPFNLAESVIRLSLIKLAAQEHILLITIHHIATDGWSVGLMLRELSQLYNSYLAGEPPALAELPMQYADYAVWQRSWLKDQLLATQLQYWQQHLGTELAVIDLPFDRPRPSFRKYQGASYHFELSRDLSQKLSQLCQKQDVTLFMLLMAAFQTLLYRYSGQTQIIVGTALANRNIVEIEPLIGFFANTLVISTRFTGQESFTELLEQVKQSALGAYAHQDMPFEKLVEALQPERSLSHTPIYQVMMVLQNAADLDLALTGIETAPLTLWNNGIQTDLILNIVDSSANLRGILEYDIELFDQSTIVRMAGHLQTLLTSIVTNISCPIGQLALLPAAERHQILVEWNATSKPYDLSQNVVSLFEQQVVHNPDSIAVISQGKSLTYAALNQKANQLAHYLKTKKVGNEKVVGICVERSLEMVIGLLGILKAGGAYLPLDPSYPLDRLSYMIEDAQLEILLTQQSLQEMLPTNIDKLCLDSQWSIVAEQPLTNLLTKIDPTNMVYLIYTSGSTGKPKGVMNVHQGLVNRLLWMQATYQLDATEVFLQKTNFSFDISVWELFEPLILGARLVMAQPEGHRDPAYLVKVINEAQITNIHFVPSMLNLFLTDPHVESCTSLRRVICSGEALTLTTQEKFFSRLDTELHNLYGPTEASIEVTAWQCQKATSLNTVPIGKPIDNIQMYILDDNFSPQPVGVVGKLYIGGVGLARGYWQKAALTAERFIPNPFSEVAEAKLYWTGDIAKYLPDGNIDFLGRADNQIKLRGYRIELGEIEYSLSSYKGIKTAVVIVAEDGEDKRLVAYLVTTNSLDLSELKHYLKKNLPDYMIPTHFVELAQLPLTPNGKIDRKALLKYLVAPEVAPELASELKPLEQMIAKIWAAVLKTPQVRRQDSFFESGGHSLLAVQLMARLQKALQVELSVRTLFEHPTLAALATYIEQLTTHQEALQIPPIQSIDKTAPRVLSFAQERIWFLQQLAPTSSAYNMFQVLRLRGHLDVGILKESLNQLVQRHEILRTTYQQEGEALVPVVNQGYLPELQDLNSQDLAGNESLIIEVCRQQVAQPFNLAESVMRLSLLHLAANEHILIIMLHHIASDGWSLGLFMAELAHLYNSTQAAQPSNLRALPVQYVDYAIWQRSWLQDAFLATQLDYWQKQIGSDLPVIELPFDRPRPAVRRYQGQTYQFELGAELSQQLPQLCQQKDVTLFMLLMAAFQTLLHRYSSQNQILVGTVMANRNIVEVEPLIGLFANTLVISTHFTSQESFAELLVKVRATALGAYAHQDMPFEKLVEALQPERSLSHTPIYQVMMVLQNAGDFGLSLTGLEVTPLPLLSNEVKTDLTLHIMTTLGQLSGTFYYDTELFDQSTIVRMVGHLQTLLTSIVADINRPISQLEILTAAERQQILVDWNATSHAYDLSQTIPSLFSQQAAATPNNIAVVFEGQVLTYQELDAQANQLAHYLISKGVGCDQLVGILLERSIEMVIAILGIMKAGAAYLPLDTQYPAERLAYMLNNAEANYTITLSEHCQLLPTSHQAICLDNPPQELKTYALTAPNITISGHDLAYVIYTSGSTGQAKGVMIEHQQLLNYVLAVRERLDLAPIRSYALAQSLAVDFCKTVLYPALIGGAVLHMISRERALDGKAMANYFSEHQIECLKIAPSHIAALHSGEDQVLPTKRLVLGGERVHWEFIETLAHAQCRIMNHYGPTETTVGVLTYEIIRQQAPRPTTIPLGRPINNVQIYILDKQGMVVPVGVAGELYIGGDSVARGYLKRADLTAEKFINDPLGLTNKRFYRSGDLVKYLADGRIEFIGRSDDQVKIRGYRIEPGEIEAAISEYKGVLESVVIAQGDNNQEKRLVAFLIGKDLDLSKLRSQLRAKLPDHMIPWAIIPLEKFPLNNNGKIDRKALLNYQIEIETKIVTGLNPLEELLAQIWQEVLKAPYITKDSNFFELGGHSLLAIQVIARTQKALQRDISLRLLFEKPNLVEFAREISQILADKPALVTKTMARVDRSQPLALSFAQERLWFLNQLDPDSFTYNALLGIRFEEALNIAALEQSLKEIIGRHEVFRTTFAIEKDQVCQIISKEIVLKLPLVDLSSLSELEREEQIKQLGATEIKRPFKLAAEPMLRTLLLKLREQEYLLLVTTHHIIFDGWSAKVLLYELKVIYEAFSHNSAPLLNEPAIQPADFAYWQRQLLKDGLLANQLDYWLKQLAQAPPTLALPTDRPRPDGPTFRGSIETITIVPELVQELKNLSHQQGMSPFMIMLAALNLLFYHWTGQTDIVIGTVSANRNRKETEQTIGCLMNFLPLRAQLAKGQTGSAFLRQIKTMVLDAYANGDYPFEKLVEAINPKRRANQSPIYNVAFLMQNLIPSQGLTTIYLPLDKQAISVLDLRFITAPENSAGEMLFNCEYNSELFDRNTIEQLLTSYLKVLRQLLQQPETSLEKFESEPALVAQAQAVRAREQKPTLAIAATFTAEPVADSLNFWLNQLALPAQLEFAPYSQVFQQLLDPASLLATNPKGINIILIRLEDWFKLNDKAAENDHSRKSITANVQDFIQALKVAAQRWVVPALVCLLPCSLASLENDIQPLQQLVVAELAGISGLYLLTATELTTAYPVKDFYDPYGDQQGHIPFTPLMFTALGTMIARKWQAINRLPYKVIVLDCDQTLWQGVCSEDGSAGIKIEAPYKALQEFMVNQHDRGMLLCLCSKNNIEDVQAVFNSREDMVIKTHHITAQRVNWETKSSNIKSLAQQLQLGLDSFIFIDDNPVECAEVASQCPEVLVLQLPPESNAIPSFLNNVWAFDRVKVTAEDRQRTLLYKQNIARESLKTEAVTLADFLAKLALQIDISPLQPEQLERVAQLTQRTNQFNFTTLRRTEQELTQLDHQQKECLVVSVTDRFGDYGLVGAIIYGINSKSLKVDSFLLSCRVLGRGVEHQMLVKLGQIAQQKGLNSIELHYIPTKKNQPAQEFLTSLKLEMEGTEGNNISYRLSTSEALNLSYQPRNIVANTDKLVSQNVSAITTATNSKLINEIATQLANPQQIWQAMEYQRVEIQRTDLATYVAPRTELEGYLARKWQEMFGLDKVSIYDNFFELGGDSIKAALFLNSLQNELGQSVYIVGLFDAPKLADFATYLNKHYAQAITKRFAPQDQQLNQALTKIDEAKVAKLRSLIPPLARFEAQPQAIKQPIVFILAPPRSGTTLLRVMLAGNSQLFSPPELQLLCFNTLAERKAAFSGRKEFWLEGTIRALMEIKGCEAETAKHLMEGYEAENLSTQQFYQLMQAELGDKILVDKTPFYALDIETLKRAEVYFEQAYYIHLTRHPYGTIKSFEEARIDQVFWYENPFSTKELAEMTWLISHENILEFLKQVPQNRQYRLRFEELVNEPQEIMAELCQFLGLAFETDMIKPHKDSKQRMTDGLQGAPRMLGDLKFHTHKDIDSQVADSWKAVYQEPFLADITLEMADLLGYRSQLDTTQNISAHTALTTIKKIARDGSVKLPLSFAQQRLWFLDQMEPNSSTYNSALAIDFTGQLNVEALQQSFTEIVKRHEVLHTTIVKEIGRPTLVITPNITVALPVVDLRGLSSEQVSVEVENLAASEAKIPFNLAKGPLLRVKLLRLGEEKYKLLMTIHHIVSDGWSYGILFKELISLYQAFSQGKPSPLAELPIQYADFAAWQQQQWLDGELKEKQLPYWKEKIGSTLTMLALPIDHPRPQYQTYRGTEQSLLMDLTLLKALKSLSRREGVTLFMTLLAAFKTLLYSYSGQEDILVGSPIAGRNRAEVEGLIGCFINILPLKTKLHPEATFRELLQQVRKTTLEAYENQDLPVEKLVEALKLRREGNRMLIQAAFALQNLPWTTLTLPDLTIKLIGAETQTSKLDLSLFMIERENGLLALFEYNTDLFESITINQMLSRFQQLLRNIVINSEESISQLALGITT